MFLGVDVGTSALKAVLTGDDGAPLASAQAAYGVSRPRPLWSEQDPELWWQAFLQVCDDLRRRQPRAFAATEALGFSGQMHACLLLDGKGSPLRPAILWNDGRAAEECRLLESRVPRLGQLAGVPAMPGFTAPKLLWLARHEPHVLPAARHLLMAKDYIRFRLSGRAAMDMADAAGTLLLDEEKRDWSDELCAAAGIDRAILPPLFEGPEITGRMIPEWQRQLGFDHAVKLVAGAGDAAAGALGIGAVNDGDVMISLGTSGQYLRATSSYRPNPQETVHAFCHGLPDMWFQMGALLNGASCAGWAAKLAGHGIDELEAETARRYEGPSSALFLPYLQGERTPHNDPLARGVLFNLSADFKAAELLQCVMEGVAFSLRDAQECLGTDTATADKPAWLVGGGARSRLWAQILANVLQKTIRTARGGQLGPALGVARLARHACSGEDRAEVFAPPELEREYTPDAALASRYASIYPRFRHLYTLLKPEFARAQAADQAAPAGST